MSRQALPAAARVSEVALTVSDLQRATSFYERILGLERVGGNGAGAALGAGGQPIVRLVHDPEARAAQGTARLYHFAILFPSRRDLADALLRLLASRWPIEGASDHLVSEAIYLSDPERNGIELYRDRPRGEWTFSHGELQMATLPLDLQRLLGEAGGDPPHAAPGGTVLGHIHLHVNDLAAAERFYREVVGLELMARYGGSASFLAAGGYHHHVAVNIWGTDGAPPAVEGSLGLRWFRLSLPDPEALHELERRLDAASVQHRREGSALRFKDPAGHTLIAAAE
jgi:catechol 2,3-dioxygenase